VLGQIAPGEQTAGPDEHGLLATGAHYAAKALPIVGGVVGGTLGAGAGIPTGPGAALSGAVGAGMGAAAGKGLQHVVDTALGYEKPIESAQDFGQKVGDMGTEGAVTTAGTLVLGPLANKVVGPVAGKLASKAGNWREMLEPVLAARAAAGEGLGSTAVQAVKQEITHPLTSLALGLHSAKLGVAKAAGNVARKIVTSPEAQQLGARALESAAEGVGALAARPAVAGSVAAAAGLADKLAPKPSPAEKIQNIVRTNPQQLGVYGPILATALQRGGQKEYDSRVFVLGQTDPGFQQLQQDLAKESE